MDEVMVANVLQRGRVSYAKHAWLEAYEARSQDAMDGFARVIGGVTSPAEFFSDENVGRIVAAAA